MSRALVADAFIKSTWEAKAGRFVSSKPAWTSQWAPGQPGLHREACLGKRNLSRKKKKYQMSILSLPLSFQGHLKICFITICVCVCFLCACMCTCVYACTMVHWSKRTTFRSRFPPSTMWVLRWNSGVRSVQQVSLSLGILTGSTGPFIFLRQNIETLSRERRPSLRVLVWQPWEAAVHVIQAQSVNGPSPGPFSTSPNRSHITAQ